MELTDAELIKLKNSHIDALERQIVTMELSNIRANAEGKSEIVENNIKTIESYRAAIEEINNY